MPIVLTTNDVTLNPAHTWNDIEGVQYHYPNQYKNKIRTGDEFVYYRGIHRKGGRRGQAEYFGRGRIGAIRVDPSTEQSSRPSWFCDIEGYVPFNPALPAKADGIFYEKILPNMWRNGVRDLDQGTFAAIVGSAPNALSGSPSNAAANLVPIEADNLIVPPARVAGSSRPSYRKSNRAKEVGDWAEKAALLFIRETLRGVEIVHRAAIAETPGWDIDYMDDSGTLHRIEVKGTVGAAFITIDITAGELAAARKHADEYWLYLVTGCLTERPRIQRIANPAGRLEKGDWTIKASLYSVRLS